MATRGWVCRGRTECSANMLSGMRSCAATEALFDLRNTRPSASVAPAGVNGRCEQEVPMEGVEKLVEFMKKFEEEN